MIKVFVTFLSGVAIAGAAASFIPGATSPARAQAGGAAECPEHFSDGDSLTCHCPSGAMADGNVWGTDVYTDDSLLCRAALHAGAVGAGGGTISVRAAPGRASYAPSTRNGIASQAWGEWRRSFTFVAAGSVASDDKTVAACPLNARDRSVGDATTCSCAATATQAGAVWGSGPYTADSIICRAAVHAGVISARGGTVRVRVTAGEASYAGSRRNGIDAGNWGSYDLSYVFER